MSFADTLLEQQKAEHLIPAFAARIHEEKARRHQMSGRRDYTNTLRHFSDTSGLSRPKREVSLEQRREAKADRPKHDFKTFQKRVSKWSPKKVTKEEEEEEEEEESDLSFCDSPFLLHYET